MINNIANLKTFQQLQKKADQIIEQEKKQEAKIFANQIAEVFNNSWPEFKDNLSLFEDYRQLIAKLRKFGGPPYEIPIEKEYTLDLKNKNLAEDTDFQEIKKIYHNIIDHQKPEEARLFVISLNEKISVGLLPEDKKSLYKKMIIGLKFTAIPTLPIENIQEILKESIADVLDIKDINIFRNLRIKLLGTPDSVRDQDKQSLRKALSESGQAIGENEIAINKETKPPQIKYWLKDYIKFLGAGVHSFIQRSNYLFQSPNCRNLNHDEKEKLGTIFQLYDILGISTWQVGSIDNPSVEQFSLPLGILNAKQPSYSSIKLPSVSPGIVLSKNFSASPDSLTTDKIKAKSKSVSLELPKEEISKTQEKPPVPEKKVMPKKIIITAPKTPPKPFIPKPKQVVKPQQPVKPPKPILKPLPPVEPEKPKPLIKPEKPFRLPVKPEEPKPPVKPEKKIIPPPPAPPKEMPKPTFKKTEPKLVRPQVQVADLNFIQAITLKEFQAQGTNTKQRAQNILMQIRKIARSHEQRTQARQLFSQSELFKLYQEMTQESQAQKKSISQIFKDRQSQSKPALSEEEYIAVRSISKLI